MEYASKGVLQFTKIQRTNISNKIFFELENDFKTLEKTETDKVSNILSNVYENTYNKNSDILNASLNFPSEKDILKAVNTKIDGKLFSDRIWDNKTKTVNMLKKLILDITNSNTTIDGAGKQIEKVFNVTAYESYRLLTNELIRVQAAASIDIAKKAGIKKHIWSAKFEHTCFFCMEQDGKIYAIDDSEAPEIPAHVLYKCVWVNIANN
ncbi:hypothetical protein [Clostridium pasteurianum]|uniref:Phage head morphogenesis protein, SPP1 gp7 family n=1 Tax=Clostridium pasteurianum BC1 TaxID=86416 RepID=R4K4M9_CLOPA|nr:hypothetical protein [Clostridium pasteurianum]AGK98112.1 hypothetical protein Clopa_3311 [Clostridium pasteurianum BC1]